MQSWRMTLRFSIALTALLTLIAAGIPAQANLIITPTFDSTITSDSNSAAIEGVIGDAISVFEATYTSPIDVPIYFQEGGGLGESNFLYYDTNYGNFYNALVATDANPAAVAGLTANGGDNFFNPVTDTMGIEIKSTNARALGIDVAPGCLPTGLQGSMECASGNIAGPNSVDGIISLNTNVTDPGSPGSSNSYGLLPTVEHEIDEILGLGSSLPNISASSGTVNFLDGNPAPEDLFRYSSTGIFSGAVSCASPGPAYFSYTGATVLTQFNNSCNNADFGDWASGASAQVQDAYGSPAPGPVYGPNEIAGLSSIGYTVAPEPATWILLLTPLAALALARRRLVTAPPGEN